MTHLNLKWSVLAAALFCVAAISQEGRAVPISATGVADVQEDVDPEIGVFASVTSISSPVNQGLSDTPVELDVMFLDMKHLEIFDFDAGDFGGMEAGFDVVAMEISVQNSNSTEEVELLITLEFLDMNGNVITPAALDSDSFGNHIPISLSPDSGLIGFSRIFRAELMSGLKFHGIRVGLTGTSDLFWNDLSFVEIRKIDDTSNVGIWAPEPSSGVLLLLAAALATAMQFRRRIR
jgi:hypothetical protein